MFNFRPDFKAKPKTPSRGFGSNFKPGTNYIPGQPSAPLAVMYSNVKYPLAQLNYIYSNPGFNMNTREEAFSQFQSLLSNTWGQNSLLI